MLRFVGIASAALFVLTSAPARAVDLPPLPTLDPVNPIIAGGGWYLRGDVGVGATSGSRVHAPTVALTPIDTALVRQRIDDGWSLSGGVGYRFGASLRADLTIGGLYGQRFSAVGIDAANVGNPAAPAAYYGARVNTTVALVNGYWDILTWEGITPFVGAGVGVAYNRLHQIDRAEVAAPFAAISNPAVMARGSDSQPAFALYAGLAYEIMPGVTAELAYRYLNVGSVSGRPGICGGGFVCAAATPLRVKSLSTQDVTLGVRWSLSGV